MSQDISKERTAHVEAKRQECPTKVGYSLLGRSPAILARSRAVDATRKTTRHPTGAPGYQYSDEEYECPQHRLREHILGSRASSSAMHVNVEVLMKQGPDFRVYFGLILAWAMSYRRHPQITVWPQPFLN